MKKAAIIMGSDSDFAVMSKAVTVLKGYGIPYEVHVYSAHRTPVQAAEFAAKAKENGFGVIIAGAGMAAALAGVLAAHTTLPVIGVPLKSAVLEGTDALLATVMMPSGIPVATVAIDGAKNAAYLAAEIIALTDDDLAAKITADRKAQSDGVLAKDKAIQDKVKEL
jgi:5-(carboxyamino)imidazole ribonucleotide mutase